MHITKQIHIYDSAQRGPHALDELREVFHYRNLIYQLVRRDVLTRYKRSVLGIAWTMLNPLGMMLVLSLAFSQILRMNIPGYSAFVLSGLMGWNFFSQTTTASMVNLVWGGEFAQADLHPALRFCPGCYGNWSGKYCFFTGPHGDCHAGYRFTHPMVHSFRAHPHPAALVFLLGYWSVNLDLGNLLSRCFGDVPDYCLSLDVSQPGHLQ